MGEDQEKADAHADEAGFETVFEEDAFLCFGPCNVVSESAYLDFLTVRNRREKVKEGPNY